REAAVERVDVLRGSLITEVERVVEPTLRAGAVECEQARLAGRDPAEWDLRRTFDGRRAWLHEAGEDLLVVERDLVRVIAAELAGLRRIGAERQDREGAVDRRVPALRAARDDEPADALRQELMVRLRPRERERDERGRRDARHPRGLARIADVLPVVAARGRERRRREVVRE